MRAARTALTCRTARASYRGGPALVTTISRPAYTRFGEGGYHARHEKRISPLFFCASSRCCLHGAGAYAQFDTATVVGTVRDNTGAVVPGATVTLTNLDTGIAATRCPTRTAASSS